MCDVIHVEWRFRVYARNPSIQNIVFDNDHFFKLSTFKHVNWKGPVFSAKLYTIINRLDLVETSTRQRYLSRVVFLRYGSQNSDFWTRRDLRGRRLRRGRCPHSRASVIIRFGREDPCGIEYGGKMNRKSRRALHCALEYNDRNNKTSS